MTDVHRGWAGLADRRGTLFRQAYAQAWEGPQPVELAAFRDWAVRYVRAAPRDRSSLEAEGIALVRARRPVMVALIKDDPQRALAVTVPAVVRQVLPAAVIAELESRVAGAGDQGLRPAGQPEAGVSPHGPALRRVAVINGATYSAYVYGRREGQLAKEDISLHGIALDGQLAVHESPVRVLEPGEIPASAPAPQCPVSGLAVEPLVAGQGANEDGLNMVESRGRVLEFCGGMNMLEQFVGQLETAEAGSGPRAQSRVAAGDAGVQVITAASAVTANTVGVKQVLVLRVDTSDFPGDPITADAAQTAMDVTVKSNLEAFSYGRTSVASTVSPKVYRLPRTGSSYAVAGDTTGLHADAVTAASGDYTAADFDRIVVVHPRLSTVPGSQITYGGEALLIGGTKVLINGGVNIGSVTHELGHCYGLLHSNLWQVTDGNPVSAAGNTVEYGDPFGMMDDGAYAFSSNRDIRFHFNPWEKNHLGWLPDGEVTTVTASGTYRIYRFDHPGSVALNQPLALRIFRDGVHWYWVGLRQNFTTAPNLNNGAYVIWGTNSTQQTQLLDLTTPGVNSSDAGLAVGTTFTDADYGISIRPVARGGTDPAQYLDVQVTIPAAPPSVVAAWGREGALFYAGNTGIPNNPEPETYVPPGLTGVSAFSAGDLHAIALKTDGSVVAWGDNTNGQISLPANLAGNVVAVVAGGNISGVVKRDGTVQLWGESVNGVTSPPAGLTGVRQLAIGGSHSVGIYHALALKNDGTVVAWGDNTRGQATVPANLANVVSVAASDRLSVALKADGTVLRWGTTFTGAVAFPTGLGGVTAIASSGAASHVLALKADGTVIAWGNNANGQATVPSDLANVVGIATGGFHSLALKADGSVVAWGFASNGQLAIPAGLPRAVSLAAGTRASFALTAPNVFIDVQPQSIAIAAGAPALFGVAAVGSGGLAYQWRKDGVAIAGATNSVLALTSVAIAEAGRYDVVVTDTGSNTTVTSFPAALTVTAPVLPGVAANPARLIDLSILTTLAPGEGSFSMVTVIGGDGTAGNKALLARAAGPALAGFGVTGTLPDPSMVLVAAGKTIAANNDWLGDPVLAAVFSRVGAFPYTSTGSKDAAVYQPGIASGGYSVVVTDATGGTGAVLAELYDATPASSFTTTTPRLINVSVLKNIGTGLAAGFVIGGSGSEKILVRAVGPSLSAFGVGGLLLNPQMVLGGAGGVQLATNDDWGGDPALVAAFGQVGAFALADPKSKDAALLKVLPAGSYSVLVTGVGGTTGTALIEVYEVP